MNADERRKIKAVQRFMPVIQKVNELAREDTDSSAFIGVYRRLSYGF